MESSSIGPMLSNERILVKLTDFANEFSNIRFVLNESVGDTFPPCFEHFCFVLFKHIMHILIIFVKVLGIYSFLNKYYLLDLNIVSLFGTFIFVL
jgi:hypothetical protein